MESWGVGRESSTWNEILFRVRWQPKKNSFINISASGPKPAEVERHEAINHSRIRAGRSRPESLYKHRAAGRTMVSPTGLGGAWLPGRAAVPGTPFDTKPRMAEAVCAPTIARNPVRGKESILSSTRSEARGRPSVMASPFFVQPAFIQRVSLWRPTNPFSGHHCVSAGTSPGRSCSAARGIL